MDSSPSKLVERVEARDEAASQYLADKSIGQSLSARAQLTGANLLDTGYTLAHAGPIMVGKGLFIGSTRGLFAGIVGVSLMGMLGIIAGIGGFLGLASAPIALGIIGATTVGWALAQAVTEYNHKLTNPNKGAELADKWTQKAGAAPLGEEPSKTKDQSAHDAAPEAPALPAAGEATPSSTYFRDKVGRVRLDSHTAAIEQAKTPISSPHITYR